jgi:hypothetical protein
MEAALHQVQYPAEDEGRPDEHPQIAVEGDKIPQGHRSGDYTSPPHEEYRQRSHTAGGGHDWQHEAAQSGHCHVAVEVARAYLAECPDLVLLSAVSLDKRRRGYVFLRLAGKPRQLFLSPLGATEHRLADLLDNEDHQGEGNYRDKGQKGTDLEHQEECGEVKDAGVDDIQHAEADQHPHVGQIIGKAGKDVAGPLLGEKSEIEGKELCIERLADLELDAASCM